MTGLPKGCPKNGLEKPIDPTESWSEHQHQVQVIRYRDFVVAHKLPGHEALKWLHSVPNGGQRHVLVAAKLKAEGVLRGVSDLMLDWRMGDKSGLRVELKACWRGAKPTREQALYLEHAESQGFVAVVCHGYKEAWRAICDYLQIQDPLGR
jgi:hypothetical protein